MKKLPIIALAASALFLGACNDDDDNASTNNGNLEVNLTGLESLGNDYVYEGWLIVNGEPVSTGTFTSVQFPQSFEVNAATLSAASKFVLSIEPAVDNDPAPAATKILAGDFTSNTANVSTQEMLGDLNNAAGKYILATPTDNDPNNETSGIWFLDNSSGSAMAGLSLPELPAGWKYEGWVVMNGTPVSTGTFTAVDMADDNAATSPYKGTAGNGPAYPGEDFLMGSYAGINFPADLKGKTAVISVEPYPDNAAAPFALKPLAHTIGATATSGTVYNLGAGPLTEISGTVTR